MRKGDESKISFCHPKDLRASTHTYHKPGGIKFWDLVEDSNTGCPSSVTVRMEYFFSFQSWYCELYEENWWRGGKKHCFVDFCSLVVL